MKAIVELSQQEYQKYTDIKNLVNSKIKESNIKEIVRKSYTTNSGHAHYKFSGKCPQELIDALGRMPTEEELIIIVDGGFSHFGANCTLNKDGSFSGRVNTD